MSTNPSSSDKPTRHICHCGKAFLRKEHLIRHKATHDQPSFVCHVCDRSFSRKDILRKHISVHDSARVLKPKGRVACDGCHKNKIKCDAEGDTCSPCVKKGKSCTFYRLRGSSEASDAPLDSHLLPSAFNDTDTDAVRSLGIETNRMAHGRKQGDSLQKRRPNCDRQIALTSVQYIMSCISAAIAGKTESIVSPTTLEPVQVWQRKYISAYLAGFHERWPLAHAPTLEIEIDDPLLLRAVLMIAAWGQHDEEDLREMIISIHERLVVHLQERMLSQDEGLDCDEQWPFQLYSTVLLSIIFAFETGIIQLIVRARHLLVLLVGAFRERRIFSPEAVDAHESMHHPGTFRPWHFQHREKWKWLVLCLVKIDTYMALMCNQPPTILVNELELDLPSHFALANAHGLDKFQARDPENPVDRLSCTMAAMARSSETTLVSGRQIEDVWLGLCGTFADIWNRNQLKHIQGAGTSALHHHLTQSSILSHLQSSNLQLQSITDLANESARYSEAANRLLRAYRGEEDTNTPDWESIVRKRIGRYTVNAHLLYHLLGIHCMADVKSMTVMALGSWSMTGSPAVKSDAMADERVRRWAATPEARISILHTLHILKIYEDRSGVLEAHHLDPIGLVALSTAGMVFRYWILSGSCCCGKEPVINLDMNVSFEENSWVRDAGVVAIDGMSLCVCWSNTWMALFGRVLKQQGKGWDLKSKFIQQWLPN